MSDLEAARQECTWTCVNEYSVTAMNIDFTVFAKYLISEDDYELYWVYVGDQNIIDLLDNYAKRAIQDAILEDVAREGAAMRIDEGLRG